MYFNPRSPCGERPLGQSLWPGEVHFNPRSPCGERRRWCCRQHSLTSFQSTLPVWGATALRAHRFRAVQISIHAPRVGSDRRWPPSLCVLRDFNPRSPCGERQGKRHPIKLYCVFQSTLPVWGATPLHRFWISFIVISIHAPRVGSDRMGGLRYADRQISIHAPRVGSDMARLQSKRRKKYFNPRSPCGERPKD